MNQQTPQQMMAVSLALSLFLVSTLLTATTARHTPHSGHDQSTHQQTWCGWLCAAGQAIQTPALEPTQTLALIANTDPFLPRNTSTLLPVSPQSRAPPLITSKRFPLFFATKINPAGHLNQTLGLV